MKPLIVLIAIAALCGPAHAAASDPATPEQLAKVVDAAANLAATAAEVIDQHQATAAAVAKIEAEVAEFAEIKAQLLAENAALREALEKKVGKTEAQLIEEANRANIRAAKAEGELLKLRAARAADPFAPASGSFVGDPFAPAVQAPSPARKWIEVTRHSPLGDTNTPPFTIGAQEWRVRWKGPKGMNLYVYTPGKRAYVESFSVDASSRVAEGSIYAGPGVYYLTSIGGEPGWSAVVEELR